MCLSIFMIRSKDLGFKWLLITVIITIFMHNGIKGCRLRKWISAKNNCRTSVTNSNIHIASILM